MKALTVSKKIGSWCVWFRPDTRDMPSRRYDLDWLRVAVFALLFCFHIGMFYVQNWGWHVKSQYLNGDLDKVMLFVEPWRMASLWLISGIAIRFVLAKVSLLRFVTLRSYRLLLPLAFGILVIVPPQLYFEMTANGDLHSSYWQFYQAFFTLNSPMFEKYRYGIFQHINGNHLWYLQALWKYSLYLIPLLPLFNSAIFNRISSRFFKLKGMLQIALALIPIAVIQLTVELDQVRYPLGFLFLCYGYLIGWNTDFWAKVKAKRKTLLSFFLINYLLFVSFYSLVFMGDDPALKDGLLGLVGMCSYALQRLLGLLMILGYAHQYLNKQSNKLGYFSEAVYPFYIVHQTIIVVAGSLITQFALGPILEPLALFAMTISGCFISYEVIRRSTILRPMFGLKQEKVFAPKMMNIGYVIAAIVIIPLAYQSLN
jgi:hypothetical protein